MTTSFVHKRKKKKHFILIGALSVLLILVIVTWKRLPKEPVVPANDLPEKAEIDFNRLEAILNAPILEKFIPFEQITPIEELGRENPFIPF